MELIADISSIMTIILFVFYFVGRIILILKEKKAIYERVDLIVTNDEEIFSKYKIVDEFILEDDGNEYMIITPREKSYNWIKIFEYKDDSLKKKNIKYYRKKLLNKDFSLKIKTNLAEGIPKYLIMFERDDYMIGELPISMNGKNGVEEELIKCKLTLKSILYYMLK